MEYLSNCETVSEIVNRIFRPRQSDYSQYLLKNSLADERINQQVMELPNHRGQKIYTSLFSRCQDIRGKVCIVFMHGYGSNRTECMNIFKALDEQVLCSFDFSGSGKSEGTYVTYGIKEKHDIHCVLEHLRSLGLNKFVLWGRSMGATSALMYCTEYNPKDVFLQVIDSGFYSFEKIAVQIAERAAMVPQFVIGFVLELARKNCQKFDENPFSIELNNVSQCRIPALFVYSEKDSVINPNNSYMIMSRFKAPFEKLLIDENHNNVRTPKTIAKIFLFIRKYAVERIISKDKTASNFNRKNKSSQAIEVVSGRLRASLPNCENKFITRLPRVSSLKKGIERVNMDTMQPNEHYGIWVSSKLKCDSTRVEKKTEDYVKLLNRDPRFQIGNLRTNFHQSAFNNQSVNQSPLNKHSPYQSIYTTYYPTETFTPERSAASKGSKTTKPEFVLSHASYL